MIGGFGTAGMPSELIDALIDQGARELTIVNNNAGNAKPASRRCSRRAACARSSARSRVRSTPTFSTRCTAAGEIELELVPQGNLAERIRAAGAGIGAFFTPTAYGNTARRGQGDATIDGRNYVLEYPIHADFALIKAERADRWGNLVYRQDRAQLRPDHGVGSEVRIRAGARDRSAGALDAEAIVTPGIFVQSRRRDRRAPTGRRARRLKA
jgi:3-oxoadipate CoA-transferase alpha subunit